MTTTEMYKEKCKKVSIFVPYNCSVCMQPLSFVSPPENNKKYISIQGLHMSILWSIQCSKCCLSLIIRSGYPVTLLHGQIVLSQIAPQCGQLFQNKSRIVPRHSQIVPVINRKENLLNEWTMSWNDLTFRGTIRLIFWNDLTMEPSDCKPLR